MHTVHVLQDFGTWLSSLVDTACGHIWQLTARPCLPADIDSMYQ